MNTTGPHRPECTKALVAMAAMVALYVVFQVVPLLANSQQNDFKHIYLGAVLMGQGASPYDAELMKETAFVFAAEDPRFRSILPYVYLPFTGMVLWPLSLLPFRVAAVVWQLCNHLFVAAGLALAACAGGWRWHWKSVLLVGGAVVVNATLYRQNNAGQLNAALLFGSGLLAVGLARGWKPMALGGIAAALMLFKITPGIFLIWFLLAGRWRCAAWMGGWAAGLTLLSALIAGFGTHLEFLPVLADMGYGKSTWAAEGMTFWRDPMNQSVNSLMHHLFVAAESGRPWADLGPAAANGLTWLVSLALLGVFVFVTWKNRGTGFGPRQRATFALAILTSLLVPSIMWDHYLVQALVAAALLWPICGAKGRAAIVLAVAVFCINFVVVEGRLIVGWAWPGRFAAAIAEWTGGGGEGLAALAQLSRPLVTFPADRGVGWLAMSLKLWPALGLFALAALKSQTATQSVAPEES